MTVFEEVATHKFRSVKTLIFCLSFTTMGLGTSMKGPALLDLQLMTSSTIEEITKVLPAEALGMIIGCIFCASTITYLDEQIFIILGLLFSGLSAIAIPYLKSCIWLCIDFVSYGFFFGFICTAGNAWLQGLWQKAAPPFLQAFHFCFGLGALCGPFIVQPFLLPLNRDDEPSKLFQSNSTNVSSVYRPEDVRIAIPYSLAGGLTVATGVVFAIVFMCKRKDSPHPTKKLMNQNSDSQTGKPPSTFVVWSVISCCCVFMLLYWALELGNGYLIAIYAVKSRLHLSKKAASLLTSVFWATFTFFRLALVFIVDLLGCQNVILIGMLLIVVSNGIFLCFSLNYEWALWLAVAIMGAGLSPIFAAMLGFLAEIVPVTSRITSMVMVSSSFGSFIIPEIVGRYIEDYPEVFLVLNGIAGLGCALFFGLMILIKSTLKGRKK